MILQFLTFTVGFRCFTPLYREYSNWDKIEFFLMLILFTALYVGCAYYFLYTIKLFTDRLKRYFNQEKS